jgi:hypothetical protein
MEQAGGDIKIEFCLSSFSHICIPLFLCDFGFDNGYIPLWANQCLCHSSIRGPTLKFLVSKLGIAGRGGSRGINGNDGMRGLTPLAGYSTSSAFAVLALFVGRRDRKGLSKRKKKEPTVNLQVFATKTLGRCRLTWPPSPCLFHGHCGRARAHRCSWPMSVCQGL